LLICAFLTCGIVAAPANAASPASVATDEAVAAFALQWYEQMQAGKFDRAQYADTYGAQLTPGAVRAMSQHLNQYGASPLRAEIMKERSVENQKFYLVKFIFPAAMRRAFCSVSITMARSPASVSRAWRETKQE
jgi:hypothetical protein